MQDVIILTLYNSELKKVLIITYYWPPSGGVAVQRWVKMSKFLREFGWEPVIYTAENAEMPVIDHSLEASIPLGLTVIKRPIWEPYDLYKRFLGYKKQEKIGAGFLQEKKKPGVLQKFSVWVRGNFFIPDARKFWIKPSVKFLSEYLQNNPVDAIISSGPPHSMHLIAMGVKEKLHIPWIADFRDPWTKIDYYQELNLSDYADKKHHALEQKVLRSADKVVTVSKHWASDFNLINNNNTEVITNGFDEDDFDKNLIEIDRGFILHHSGMINKARNPELLWEVLAELCKENEEFNKELKIQLTGNIDFTVSESIANNKLQDKLVHIEHLAHNEAVQAMQRSPVLLLLLNDTHDILGRIPAKLFEYLAAGRPILVIGNVEGDAAVIIKETNSGVVAEMNNKNDIREKVLLLFDQYKRGQLKINSAGIEKYARRENAKNFAKILDGLYKTSAKI